MLEVVESGRMEGAPGAADSGSLPVRAEGIVFESGGRRLLDGIDLELGRGTRTVVMGPNGAGKSLLLRILHGLITPTAGRVTFAGKAADPAVRRRQAMVFQRPVLLRRSVKANIAYALKIHGVPGGERSRQVDEALQTARLEELAGSPARVLSGGEQQRLALARALSVEPEILFLDEPTASLDPASVLAIEELVLAAAERGTKIVWVTHDLGQAKRLADEVVFLHRGRLVEHSAAFRFFRQPASQPASDFVAGKIVI